MNNLKMLQTWHKELKSSFKLYEKAFNSSSPTDEQKEQMARDQMFYREQTEQIELLISSLLNK